MNYIVYVTPSEHMWLNVVNEIYEWKIDIKIIF